MNAALTQLAKELGLIKEYKTIRVAGGEVVKVEDRINDEHQRILEAAYKAGAVAEREACAAVAESRDGEIFPAIEIAAAIRARGEA